MTKISQYTPKKNRLAAIEGATSKIDPPNGIRLNRAERPIWDALMKTRPPEAWSPADKLSAYKVVKLENLVRLGYGQLDAVLAAESDPFVSDSIAAEYLDNIGKLEKRILSLMRSIGVTKTGVQVKNADKLEKEAQLAEDAFGEGAPARSTILAVN